MKEITKLEPNNPTYPIPSRDEFHRYYCGTLSIDDFSTMHPTRYTIERIASAIQWSKKIVPQKNK